MPIRLIDEKNSSNGTIIFGTIQLVLDSDSSEALNQMDIEYKQLQSVLSDHLGKINRCSIAVINSDKWLETKTTNNYDNYNYNEHISSELFLDYGFPQTKNKKILKDRSLLEIFNQSAPNSGISISLTNDLNTYTDKTIGLYPVNQKSVKDLYQSGIKPSLPFQTLIFIAEVDNKAFVNKCGVILSNDDLNVLNDVFSANGIGIVAAELKAAKLKDVKPYEKAKSNSPLDVLKSIYEPDLSIPFESLDRDYYDKYFIIDTYSAVRVLLEHLDHTHDDNNQYMIPLVTHNPLLSNQSKTFGYLQLDSNKTIDINLVNYSVLEHKLALSVDSNDLKERFSFIPDVKLNYYQLTSNTANKDNVIDTMQTLDRLFNAEHSDLVTHQLYCIDLNKRPCILNHFGESIDYFLDMDMDMDMDSVNSDEPPKPIFVSQSEDLINAGLTRISIDNFYCEASLISAFTAMTFYANDKKIAHINYASYADTSNENEFDIAELANHFFSDVVTIDEISHTDICFDYD